MQPGADGLHNLPLTAEKLIFFKWGETLVANNSNTVVFLCISMENQYGLNAHSKTTGTHADLSLSLSAECV